MSMETYTQALPTVFLTGKFHSIIKNSVHTSLGKLENIGIWEFLTKSWKNLEK